MYCKKLNIIKIFAIISMVLLFAISAVVLVNNWSQNAFAAEGEQSTESKGASYEDLSKMQEDLAKLSKQVSQEEIVYEEILKIIVSVHEQSGDSAAKLKDLDKFNKQANEKLQEEADFIMDLQLHLKEEWNPLKLSQSIISGETRIKTILMFFDNLTIEMQNHEKDNNTLLVNLEKNLKQANVILRDIRLNDKTLNELIKKKKDLDVRALENTKKFDEMYEEFSALLKNSLKELTEQQAEELYNLGLKDKDSVNKTMTKLTQAQKKSDEEIPITQEFIKENSKNAELIQKQSKEITNKTRENIEIERKLYEEYRMKFEETKERVKDKWDAISALESEVDKILAPVQELYDRALTQQEATFDFDEELRTSKVLLNAQVDWINKQIDEAAANVNNGDVQISEIKALVNQLKTIALDPNAESDFNNLKAQIQGKITELQDSLGHEILGLEQVPFHIDYIWSTIFEKQQQIFTNRSEIFANNQEWNSQFQKFPKELDAEIEIVEKFFADQNVEIELVKQLNEAKSQCDFGQTINGWSWFIAFNWSISIDVPSYPDGLLDQVKNLNMQIQACEDELNQIVYNPVPGPQPVPVPNPWNGNEANNPAQTGDAIPFAAVAVLAIVAALGCGIALRKNISTWC